MTDDTPPKFPKVKAPYIRNENTSGNYVVTKTVLDENEWVFSRAKEVDAVEKLHGTNVAVLLNDNEIRKVSTRKGDRTMNPVETYKNTQHHSIVRGIQNSYRRGYLDELTDGWNYGELVGPKIQSNPYDLDENLFIPFDWLRENCTYKSYGEYPTDFESISNWLENDIFSLFYAKMKGKEFEKASVSNGVFVEGIVFVHPSVEKSIRPQDIQTRESDKYDIVTNHLSKLRRDMYEWF